MSVAGYIGKNVKAPRSLCELLDRELFNNDARKDEGGDTELKSLELKRDRGI
jgi:hypothetical protein